MVVPAGRLNNLIDILQPDYKDKYKEIVDYVPLYEGVPAQKKDQASATGGETQRGQKAEETTDTIFTIRYLSGIEKKMRVRCESVEFEIRRVVDRDGRKNWLELHCVDVV